ncbi:hypothetical protein DFH09DRAFT_1145632 [Mycena vulgaris]|nr:hypothetical protein DFH09DRAFT_1145632 [Mycena vulgaris]
MTLPHLVAWSLDGTFWDGQPNKRFLRPGVAKMMAYSYNNNIKMAVCTQHSSKKEVVEFFKNTTIKINQRDKALIELIEPGCLIAKQTDQRKHFALVAKASKVERHRMLFFDSDSKASGVVTRDGIKFYQVGSAGLDMKTLKAGLKHFDEETPGDSDEDDSDNSNSSDNDSDPDSSSSSADNDSCSSDKDSSSSSENDSSSSGVAECAHPRPCPNPNRCVYPRPRRHRKRCVPRPCHCRRKRCICPPCPQPPACPTPVIPCIPTCPPCPPPPCRPCPPPNNNICGDPNCGMTFICTPDYNRVVQPMGYPGVGAPRPTAAVCQVVCPPIWRGC